MKWETPFARPGLPGADSPLLQSLKNAVCEWHFVFTLKTNFSRAFRQFNRSWHDSLFHFNDSRNFTVVNLLATKWCQIKRDLHSRITSGWPWRMSILVHDSTNLLQRFVLLKAKYRWEKKRKDIGYATPSTTALMFREKDARLALLSFMRCFEGPSLRAFFSLLFCFPLPINSIVDPRSTIMHCYTVVWDPQSEVSRDQLLEVLELMILWWTSNNQHRLRDY